MWLSCSTPHNNVGRTFFWSAWHLRRKKKNLAFRLAFQAPDRTLQDTEVHEARDKIVQSLSDKFGAQLRS